MRVEEADEERIVFPIGICVPDMDNAYFILLSVDAQGNINAEEDEQIGDEGYGWLKSEEG